MARLIFILGGARSGKSRFAQQLAERLGGDNVLFVATAEAGDLEMAHRIAIHQRSRPTAWTTLERPMNVGAALENNSERYEIVLIDCLTLLVSNLLFSCGEPPDADTAQRVVNCEMERLVSCLMRRPGTAIVISGEVGLGLVPENALGRLYRDLLGWANQYISRQAEATYLMVSGLAVEIQSLATSLEQAAARCLSPPDASLNSEQMTKP